MMVLGMMPENMDYREDEYLQMLWQRNICPFCGKQIPDGTRVGTGRKQEGGFCSLDCYTHYYALELLEKARRLKALCNNTADI
jgi:hypothetical protein